MKTYIVAYGGSIVIPGKTYDHVALENLANIVIDNPEKQFVFVIGGGKICRNALDELSELLDVALADDQGLMPFAKDEIGIGFTKINAHYTRRWLANKLGTDRVYENIVSNPALLPKTDKQVIIASGFKPGVSTDYIMMHLAEQAQADSAYKISNFPVVLNVKPEDFKVENMASYKPLYESTWQGIVNLVGDTFKAGGNYPLDPPSAALGLKLLNTFPAFKLYIGQKENLNQCLKMNRLLELL